MKTERLAFRDAKAVNRIDAAFASLVETKGVGRDALEAFRASRNRDRAITAMRRHEALADFLEALNGAQLGEKAIAPSEGLSERLTAIQGVGPKLAEQIIDVLEGK